MKSTGFSNTSNEATELIRLQRQILEDKVKADKENKIKADEKEKADNEIDDDFIYYPKLRYPSLNNGGSSTLRATQNDNKNSFTSRHQGPIEDIDDDYPPLRLSAGTGDEAIMPSHKTKENDFRNVKFNSVYLTDDSDHLSAWDEPPESVFKTITPIKTTTPIKTVTPIKTSTLIKTSYDDMESDFEPAVASEFTSPVPLDFKTSSPINPKYVDKDSDFEPAVPSEFTSPIPLDFKTPTPIKTAGVIETPLTTEQKTMEDEKTRAQNETRIKNYI